MSNSSGNRGKGMRDVNQLAYDVVQKATGQVKQPEETTKKNAAAVSLGRLGGLKGGKARAKVLTPEERTAIAKKAAATRWAKQP